MTVRDVLDYFGIVRWAELSPAERRREALVGAILLLLAVPLAVLGHWEIAVILALVVYAPHAIAVRRRRRPTAPPKRPARRPP
jgi:uncharacterized membrane protein YidH (DUF202 family)